MPPSVMQIHSPRVPSHQEETTTPRGVHCPAACLVSLGTEASQPRSTPSPSQQNVALACLFAIPAERFRGDVCPGGQLPPRAAPTERGCIDERVPGGVGPARPCLPPVVPPQEALRCPIWSGGEGPGDFRPGFPHTLWKVTCCVPGAQGGWSWLRPRPLFPQSRQLWLFCAFTTWLTDG